MSRRRISPKKVIEGEEEKVKAIRLALPLLCGIAFLLALPLAAQVSAPPPTLPPETDTLPEPAAPPEPDPVPSSIWDLDLPNAPGWTLPTAPPPMPPCPVLAYAHPPAPRTIWSYRPKESTPAAVAATSYAPCIQVNPYQRFLDNTSPIPLTPAEKGYLALRNFLDPANFITIVGTAAFTVGTNSHTAYGPGLAGFGRNTGYSFSQDATGEFFGTFLIPALLHEDPHYHRMPKSSIPRRIFHAISRTAVAQHDDGTMMPNYAVLLTYPISAELSNLYVPGVRGDAASTAKRIATGLATDPIGNIITEFLPDIARRVNIRAIFVQRLLNAVTADSVSAGAGAP